MTKHFIPRFSLKTLLIAITICAICCGAYTYFVFIKPRDQKELVRKIAANNGSISYDFEIPVSAPENSWKSGLANILGKDVLGLVRSVQITQVPSTEDFHATLNGIRALGSVRDLVLPGSVLDEECIELISDMPQLTYLSICGNQKPPRNLTQLRRLTNLKNLNLSSWKELPKDLLNDLSSLPHLKELVLTFTKISSSQVEDLAKYPSLESLWIDYSGISSDQLSPLSRIRSLRELIVDPSHDIPAIQKDFPDVKIEEH